MTAVRTAVVIDSFAWVEMFIGSKKGEVARDAIQEAEEAYTPDIVLAEIARKYIREGADVQTINERLTAIEEISEVVPVDREIALGSAECYMLLAEKARREKLRPPSLFDAIVLATARTMKAKIVTGDQHFRGLDETLWVG